MTREQLNRLNDHDLLVRLHVLLEEHLKEHQKGTLTFRWTVVAILTALGVLVGAAGVIASWGNP